MAECGFALVLLVISFFCDVMGSGLRGSHQPGSREIQNTTQITQVDPALQAVLDEYGSLIADGALFELTRSDLQYTWNGFVEGVTLFNTMARERGERTFLGEPDVTLNSMTLFVVMAHLQFETADWSACKERVRDADGICPCVPPECTGGCSAGRINSYTSERAALRPPAGPGFTVVTCNGAEAPANGCVDFWGDNVEDSKNCWFGRGATQLTWPGNYDTLQSLVQAAAGVDICVDPDSICDNEIIAWVTAIGYWNMSDAPWRAAYTFDSSLAVIRPEDPSSNELRRAKYESYLAAAGITGPPVLPPPPSGTTIVQPGEGCFQIAQRVCGDGNAFPTVICHPCDPGPALGSEVEYDCNGC
jgi:hypothetical protein